MELIRPLFAEHIPFVLTHTSFCYEIDLQCVSPDYLLVHENHIDTLVNELSKAIQSQFGPNIQKSELGRLAQESHAERHVDMLKEVESMAGVRIIGGSTKCDISDRFVYPTLVVRPPRECRLLKEEVFGPILPIIPVKSRKEAQDFINSMPGIPLSMYVFTRKESVFRDMIRLCPAASAVRNDVLVHFGNPHLPMSGLGTSGYGSYHGLYSWRCFTHPQSQVYRPCYPTADFGLSRYHPFGKIKETLFMLVTDLPAIPPLYLRFWLGVGVFAYAALSLETVRFGLADGMSIVVDWLRIPRA